MYVKQENFPENVRRNKVVLKELAALITEEIQSRSSPPTGWDFRFLVIVAQWLIEQGGYTMTPEGNNPGNVVGTGDAGFFTRSYNTEFVNGVRVPRPDVKFAKYSTIIEPFIHQLDNVEAIKGENRVRGMSSNTGRIGSTHVHSHRFEPSSTGLKAAPKLP